MTREVTIRILIIEYREDRVTNTVTMRLILKPELAIVILAFFGSSIQLQQIRFGNSRRWYCSKRLLKHHVSKTRGFNHLLSLNSVIYLKNSKLDVDLDM
jgi:hypothetical protein